jgi:hypothetical protein
MRLQFRSQPSTDAGQRSAASLPDLAARLALPRARSPRDGHPALATGCRCRPSRQSQPQRRQRLGVSVAKNAMGDRARRDNKQSRLYCRSRLSDIAWSDMAWKVRPAHRPLRTGSMNVPTYPLTPTTGRFNLTFLPILSPWQTSIKALALQGLTACVAKNAIRDTMPQAEMIPPEPGHLEVLRGVRPDSSEYLGMTDWQFFRPTRSPDIKAILPP